MMEIDEGGQFIRRKKSQDIRNARLLGTLFSKNADHLSAFRDPSANQKSKRVAIDWLLRARNFFNPTPMEQIVKIWADGDDLIADGAYQLGDRLKATALRDAIANEQFELVLAMLGDQPEHMFYAETLAQLTEIHQLHQCLEQVRSLISVSSKTERIEGLGMLAGHVSLVLPARSRRAEHLQLAIRFRVKALLGEFEDALILANDLRKSAATITNEEVLRAHLQIVTLHSILGDIATAKSELQRVSLLDVRGQHLDLFKRGECALLFIYLGLQTLDSDTGLSGLRLLAAVDHDALARSLGVPRHALLCSLAVTFATLAGVPSRAEEIVTVNSLRIKKQPEAYHWLEVAMAGHYLINYEWELLNRIGRRLATNPVSEMGVLLADFISAYHSDLIETASARESLIMRFRDRAAKLPTSLTDLYPLHLILDLKIGRSWGRGGGIASSSM